MSDPKHTVIQIEDESHVADRDTDGEQVIQPGTSAVSSSPLTMQATEEATEAATEAATKAVTADEELDKYAEDDDVPVKLIGPNFFDDFQLSPRSQHYSITTPREMPNNDFVLEMPNDEKDIDTSNVLAADHPLLEKFQCSLKDQLSKRIYLLRQDVAEMEEGCKMKENDKEMVGVEAYETQQTSNKQQESLEHCINELESVDNARRAVEHQMVKVHKRYLKQKDVLATAQKEDIQVRTELETIDALLCQMKKWEDQIESELIVNQRILDNTDKFRLDLNLKKKKQDNFIYNLMNEVWQLESELETMLMQLRIKEEDRERLAEAVTLANIDIEANQSEHRCLVHGWQSVLVTITQRDKYYNELLVEYDKYDDKMSGVNCELTHVKKEIQREHFENERLTLLKERMEYETKNVQRVLAHEFDKREQFMKLTAQFEKYLNENDKQRNSIKMQIDAVHDEEEHLAHELERRNQIKYKMEQAIVTHLQTNAFTTDACRQMANVLKDFKEENRRVRINIARVEGQISNTHAEWQAQRIENNELTLVLNELKEIMTLEDGDLSDVNREFVNCEKELTKLIGQFELLKQKTAGDAAVKLEMWPQEVRIRQLEATINDLLDKNKQSQSFWLREQSIVVDLSEKRQVQMKDMNLLKKQIRIMDQKNLRINDSIEELVKKEDILNRSISSLENKLYTATCTLNKKKDSKNAMDHSNNKAQGVLVNKLEIAEFEALKMKAEILETEEDKFVLSNELVEKNREALAWEKKLMMILDARKQMHDSQSESGDICQMKSEIHRMNVRFSQLRKAQEKLMHDLDNCVFRRDSIVTLAEARTRGHKGGSQQWRVNFNKRRDFIKKELIRIDKDYKMMIKKIATKEWEIEKATEEIGIATREIDWATKHTAEVKASLTQARIDRQLNLDILTYKQRKVKVYCELAKRRTPHIVFKSQSSAHKAYVRERELNTKLRHIVEEDLKKGALGPNCKEDTVHEYLPYQLADKKYHRAQDEQF